MRRLLFLVRKELQELRRNPRLFPLIFLAPVLQLFILGYAASTDVRNVPITIVDGDRSQASRELIGRFEGSPYFSVSRVTSDEGDVLRDIETRRAWMALSIPPEYGESVAAGRPVTLQVVADGTDSNSAGLGLTYATTLIADKASELALARRPRGRPAAGAIEARIRVWFNPQLLSRHFMVPGVLALLLMVITSVLGSMAVVREKELGTLEQLNVTPLRRWELIAGKLLPYGLIGTLDVFLVVGVAALWFEVPLRGSFPLLLGLSMVYLLCTLGLGLLVSTLARNQQQAMMTAVFFFMMPMIYLSGFVFPIENMPAAIQPLTYLVPLRYYLVIVRGIFLKGVGLEAFWPDALLMLAWGAAVLALATARSRKTLA
ncbi:MAG TPA: ABC transporter permease [Vicinamibacterales bacterium]|nr:ABC transporter permease [Vicinamibacterales bacterium]HOQ58989.1 ABC transporter permease [Vicinamibacterales bacterium]HPK72976.1 ABC transporter permease [Vicinamibacterales bacterium]